MLSLIDLQEGILTQKYIINMVKKRKHSLKCMPNAGGLILHIKPLNFHPLDAVTWGVTLSKICKSTLMKLIDALGENGI
jgi:hypothetical protein